MTAATQTRAERVEEFVRCEAWMEVAYTAAHAASALGIDDENILNNLTGGIRFPAVLELWPNDDDDVFACEGDPEYEAAVTRSMLLQAAILMQLTTDEGQDYLRTEAARLAKHAADRGVDAAEGTT